MGVEKCEPGLPFTIMHRPTHVKFWMRSGPCRLGSAGWSEIRLCDPGDKPAADEQHWFSVDVHRPLMNDFGGYENEGRLAQGDDQIFLHIGLGRVERKAGRRKVVAADLPKIGLAGHPAIVIRGDRLHAAELVPLIVAAFRFGARFEHVMHKRKECGVGVFAMGHFGLER